MTLKNLITNDNYSAKVTFAHAHTLKPLYMKILKALIDHPQGLQRFEAINLTHDYGNNPFHNNKRGYLQGPFTLLKGNGFATYKHVGHKRLWIATSFGIQFYYQMQIEHDLNRKVA